MRSFLAQSMVRTLVLLYFSLLALAHAAALFSPMYLSGMTEAAPVGLFFLISIPFALLTIFWPGLQARQLIYFFLINAVLQILIYTFLTYTGDRSLELFRIRHAYWPVVQSQGILLLFCIMIGVGLHMRSQHEQSLIRRRGTDKEELENLFELKLAQSPETGLTFFRYRQLMATGIGIVASRGIKILASVQLIPRYTCFYIYDLLGGPDPLESNDGILYLFENLLQRPEISYNQPDALVYLFRKSDERLRLLLEDYGFKRVELNDNRTRVWRIDLDNCVKTKFEGWEPFNNLECYYVLNGYIT